MHLDNRGLPLSTASAKAAAAGKGDIAGPGCGRADNADSAKDSGAVKAVAGDGQRAGGVGDVEDGGHDVGQVARRVADCALVGDAFRPVDD